MANLSYPLYDTAFFGNAAGVERTLFQEAQGATANATKANTNSRGAGQLPTNEKFIIKSVHVFPDADLTLADIDDMFEQSYLEIRLNDETMLIAPLRMFASHSSYGGHFGQAAAAAAELIGLQGDGFMLDNPIEINGGNAFRVIVFQGTALSAASLRVKVVLNGTLQR